MLIIVQPGEEVITTITKAIAEGNLGEGAFTLIGAIDKLAISVMQKSDAANDLLRYYTQPMEMHGTGEIYDGEIHIHATFAGEDVIAAGHVHSAWVANNFVRVYFV